jgi:hypothetical protein
MTPKEFDWIPSEVKGILGSMDELGVVTFFISAGEDSPVRGTEMFNRMMAHFGDEARAIQGQWIRSRTGELSTNIDKVNELTAAGMKLEEAIQHAWTVTRARKLGFVNVRVLGNPVGTPGAYDFLQVLIER